MSKETVALRDAANGWSGGYDGGGNGSGGSNGYNGGTKLEGIAQLTPAKLAEMRAMGYVAQAQRENKAKQYLAQTMPSINFGEIRAEAKAPSAPAANEQTQEKAKARYDAASAQYETQSKQLDKLLAQTGDYAGYGADLEKAKTSTADAKAKMEDAAEAYKAVGGTIERDVNERVGNTIAGGAENYLASLLGTVGSYHEGGVRGSKAQIERDLADLQKQEEKARQTYDEMLSKYGDESNVNVKAAASALAEIKSNQELYQGMLDNQSLEETTAKIYGASDRMAERGAQDIAEAKEGLGAAGQFLVDTGAAGVQLLGDIALGKVTGLGMMPVMGARSYGGGANEARQAGATYEQQVGVGVATAAVEMLTEKLADGLAGAAGKGAADDAAKEIIRKWAKTDAGRTALRAVYGISGEAGEEAISTLVSPLIERIYNDESLKESYGTAEGRKNLINEALHDALIGGALGGFGTLGSLANGQNAAELADMRMRDASMGDVQSQTNNAFDVLFGNMSPEQSQAREAAALAQINANQQAAPTPTPAPATTGQEALLEAAGITPAAQPAPVETAPVVEQPAPVESAPEQTPEARQAQIQQRLDEINAELDDPNIDETRINELYAEGDALLNESRTIEQQIQARNTQQERIDSGDVSKRFGEPENHIDNRTNAQVQNPSVKAFQYDHPELHRHFVEAAQALANLVQSAQAVDTTVRNRSTDSKYYTNKRNRYDDTVRSLVELGMSKPEILQCCQDIIDNNGAENYSKAKKVELVLNDMLTNGYTTAEGLVEPNAEYIAAKEAITGAKTAPAADSWEAYLERNELALATGEVTEEQLRAEWEAQQAEATEIAADNPPKRNHIAYEDKAAHEQAFSDKAKSLVEKGKTIEITPREVQNQSEMADWGSVQSVRKYIRDSLKAIFGTDTVIFDNDGIAVEAHLTREGRKHSAPSVTNKAGAAAMLKARELVDKAEYVFSTDHDIHSEAGKNIDPDTIWDYYEAVVKYGNEIIPVRYSLRNVRDDPRAQINKIAVNADGVDAERASPNNRPPQVEVPVDNGETLSVDRVAQPVPVVNGKNAGPTTAESTNGTGPVRERGGSANIRTNENAEADLRQSFEESPETYRQLTNAEVQAKADAILAKGFDTARSEVEQAIGKAKAGYKLSPEHLVAGFEVANELTRRGETEAANHLMADIFAEQTAGGQIGQIGRLLRKASPAVKSLTVENLVNKINENLTKGQLRRNVNRGRGDAEGKITVDQALIDNFTNAQTDAESDAALDAIKDNIAAQIPATFRDKFTALRYLNMLGNLKTQGRNLIGNTAMMAATNVKYTLQAVNELVASAVSGGKYKRNTALVTSAQLRQQAAQDFADNIDEIKGESKYSDVAKQASRDIEERRQIFDFKPLEAYRKATNWAMDAGDTIFMRVVYTRSFAGWMQAHGVTDVANATPDQVSRARAFATKEAQEATFHDSNKVSDAVTNFDAKWGPVGKALSQGIIPFRRTPASVAVRAIEYSPVGVAETIYKGVQAATGKGDATAADVINSLSKNVTGSALMLAGWFLAAAGMARGSNDDDKELSAFEKMQGAMDYSVKIGGRNVSLSQFAPMAIPFFMGVKLNELMERSDEPLSLDDAGDILGIVTDPMLEMSMLSGVNDFMNDLASLNGDTDAIPSLVANAALGYLSQGLTNSFLGQMEQANEENRQTTYTDTKSADATELDKRLGKYQRIVAKAAAKIPGIDYNQQDYVDAWGRTISNGGAGERYFNALLNPTYTSKENSTEVDAELERLYKDNKGVEGFPDVLPSKRPRSATIGDGIVMTPDEYLQFSKDSGAKKLELVKDFMGSEQYKGLTDQQRADVISNLYSLADNMSLDKVKENYKVNRPTDWDKVKTLEDPVEYLTGKEILRQSGNEYKGTPDYSQIDSLLAGWGNLSADTQAELSKMANVNNMRYAYDQLGVGSGDYFDTKNTVTEAEKSQLGNKTGGAADAIVIAKTSGKTDEEKLAALEALNQPDKQTGKRAAVVRRFEAAAQYNIPFDQWAAFEAAVYDNAKNPASPSNQAIYAAEDAVGIKRGTGKQIWRKTSGDEDKVEMYDDYFSQYYEAPGQVSFTNYLANAAGLG